VEPLTPAPGSPAIQNGTPLRRSLVEIPAVISDTSGGAEAPKKVENNDVETEQGSSKTGSDTQAAEQENKPDNTPVTKE
jgi:hypothetical protein